MKKNKVKTYLEYFNLYFSEAVINCANFKYVFRFLISFYDQKLQPSKVGKNSQKRAKNMQNGPILEGCNI